MERAGKPPLILVVDDDADWRGCVRDILSPAYRIAEASSGAEGLAAARRRRPALIMLDVMMPGGMDGLRTLCELRKSPSTRNIPVIILSAVNAAMDTRFDRSELERYLGVAPAAFLEKPIPPPDLLAAVARALQCAIRTR